MINKIFHRKNKHEKALLNQIEKLLNLKCKKLADDIISKLKDIITANSNEPPLYTTPDKCANPRIHLTPRQKIVLELIVQGKTNKEVAAEIYLSAGGVKNVITTLLGKFGLEDRTQLAVSAVVNDMVSEETLSIYKNKIRDNDNDKSNL